MDALRRLRVLAPGQDALAPAASRLCSAPSQAAGDGLGARAGRSASATRLPNCVRQRLAAVEAALGASAASSPARPAGPHMPVRLATRVRPRQRAAQPSAQPPRPMEAGQRWRLSRTAGNDAPPSSLCRTGRACLDAKRMAWASGSVHPRGSAKDSLIWHVHQSAPCGKAALPFCRKLKALTAA